VEAPAVAAGCHAAASRAAAAQGPVGSAVRGSYGERRVSVYEEVLDFRLGPRCESGDYTRSLFSSTYALFCGYVAWFQYADTRVNEWKPLWQPCLRLPRRRRQQQRQRRQRVRRLKEAHHILVSVA
jgi:hypothetical protein